MADWYDTYMGQRESPSTPLNEKPPHDGTVASVAVPAAGSGGDWYDAYAGGSDMQVGAAPTQQTFDNLLQNKKLIDTARAFYKERDGKDFVTDQDALDQFTSDRTWKDANVWSAVNELRYALNTKPEQKQRLAYLRQQWEELPYFWEKGGRGAAGLGENVAKGLADPSVAAGFLVGKALGIGAKEVVKRTVTGVVTDAVITAGANAAHQATDITVGNKDKFSPGEMALSGVVGGGVSSAGHGLGVALDRWAAKKFSVAAAPKTGNAKLVEDFKAGFKSLDDVISTEISSLNKHALTQRYLDQYHGIAKALADAEGVHPGAYKLSGETPYAAYRLTANIPNMIEQMLTVGMIKRAPEGHYEFSGPSLKAVLEPVKGDVDGFLAYIAAERAWGLRKQGKKTGLSDWGALATIKDGKANPAYQAALPGYQELTRSALDFIVESSAIGAKDKANILAKGGDFFVPFNRIVEDNIAGTRVNNTGVSPTGGLIRYRGGEDSVAELLPNLVHNLAAMVEVGVKNNAKRELYDAFKAMPNEVRNLFVEPAPKELLRNVVASADVKASLKKAGMDVTDFDTKMPDDFMTFFLRNRIPSGDGIDIVLREGKAEAWRIKDQLLWEAVSSLKPGAAESMGKLGRWAWQGPADVLRNMTTHFPTFTVRNLIRDSGSSFDLSTTSTAAGNAKTLPIINVVSGLANSVINAPEYQKALLNGMGFNSIRQADRPKINAWYTRNGINPALTAIDPQEVSTMLRGWHWYEREILSRTENSARFTEYNALRAEGRSVRDSSFRARDVSTDFSMHGSSEKWQMFISGLPFFNAGLQGVTGAYRKGRSGEYVSRVVIKGLIGFTVPSILLDKLNKDEPVVQNLPDHVKDQHWVIPMKRLPDGGATNIWLYNSLHGTKEKADDVALWVKPFELGAVFGTMLGERLPKLVRDGDIHDFNQSIVRTVLDMFKLNPIPQAARPIVDDAMNQNWAGAPIVPNDLVDVDATAQHRPWSNSIIKSTAQAVGASPMRLEAGIKSYLGLMGRFTIDLADRAKRWVSRDPNDDLPSMRMDQYPVIEAFYRMEPSQSQQEIEFFRLMSKAKEASGTINKLVKEGEIDELKDLLERVPGYAALAAQSPPLRTNVDRVSGINRLSREIHKSSMTPDEKRKEIDALAIAAKEPIKEIIDDLKKDPNLARQMEAPGYRHIHEQMNRMFHGKTKEVR